MIKSIVTVPARTIIEIVLSLGITGLIAMVISIMSERADSEEFGIHFFFSVIFWVIAGIIYFGYAQIKAYLG